MAAKQNLADIYPLTPFQEGMLFHTLLAPEAGVYVEQLSCRLEGELDVASFEQAWQHVADRHCLLRTAFFWERRDRPFQVVYRHIALRWQRLSVAGLPRGRQHELVEEFLREDRDRSFELARPPLIRLSLIDLGHGARRFVWTFHHLLLDGWSVPLVLKEVFSCYAAWRGGRQPVLHPVVPFRHYVSWLERQEATAEEAFWRRALNGFTVPTPGPWSRPSRPPSIPLGHGGRPYASQVPRATGERLLDLARRHRVTLSTVLQGAWALLLSRYSGEPDVVFGVTVSGRPAQLPGVESMVGVFINALPRRVRIESDEPVATLLGRLHAQQSEVAAYEHTPLVRIQGWSQLPRGLPLFESLLVFDNYPVDGSLAGGASGVTIGDVRVDERSHYALTLVAEPAVALRLRVAYDARRFDRPAIVRMLGHLCCLLEGIAGALGGAGGPVGDLPLLLPGERHQVVREWNDTRGSPAPERCLHELFADQAMARPDAVAVVAGGRTLTYGEVNRRANRLAHLLRRLGVAPGVRVAAQLERSAEMVWALLGILKAGGAYVPLETTWPTVRCEWILRALSVRHLVADGGRLAAAAPLAAAAAVEHLIAIGEGAEPPVQAGIALWSQRCLNGLPAGDPPRLTGADDLAYVIFTSGSTGTPKGVAVQHRPVLNLIDWVSRRFSIGPADRVLCVASLCFDLSVYDLFGLLAAGGSVHVALAAELAEPARLARLLTEEPITFWDSAPAALQQLVPFLTLPSPSEGQRSLRLVFLSGDWIPLGLPDEVRAAFPGAEVIGLGGATEAAVWSNFFPIGRVEPSWASIPYGRPIANAAYHVLDPRLEPCPIGVPGDLYIGGGCLAAGYVQEPALTAGRYLPDHLAAAAGGIVYRTGDRARRWPDGTIEFLGRVDGQVKLRGFRIELGEIEAQLGQHPGVSAAVAVVREDEPGQRRIVAYVLHGAAPAPGEAELRGFLEQRLPPYMVPSAFVALDSLPTTPNGKLDRRALPVPEPAGEGRRQPSTAPRGPVEEVIAGFFSEVLGRPPVGAQDDFFELGGHSLLATQLVARVRKVFRVDLPLRALFEAPTVTALATEVEHRRRQGLARRLPPLMPVKREGSLPLSFAQHRLWFADRMDGRSGAYNIGIALHCEGRLETAVLERVLGELLRRHEVLRTKFPSTAGSPVQVVGPGQRPALAAVDLSGLVPEIRDEAARGLAARELRRPFDLAAGPLLRCTVLRLGSQRQVMVFALHHIVADGWSMGILVREVGALYEAFSAGRPSPLGELPVQYADYSVWQRDHLQEEALAGHLEFWKRQLAGIPTELSLPGARPRTRRAAGQSGRHRFELPMATTAALAALGRREGATLFITILAAFQALLHRVCGVEDLVVGTDVANRSLTESEGMIGYFVNQLALRADLTGNPPFRVLLQRVRDRTLEAYEHQDLPFEQVVEALRPARDGRRPPLFQVTYTHQNAPLSELRLPGLAVTPFEVEPRPVHFDLSLITEVAAGCLVGHFGYQSEALAAADVAHLSRQLETLLGNITKDPEARLHGLEVTTTNHRRSPEMQKDSGARVSFKKFKPTPVSLGQQDLVRTRQLADVRLPLLVEPAIEDLDGSAWAQQNRQFIESSLLRHGAILFRGFALGEAERFEHFARVLCPDLFNENGEHPRESLGGDIYTPVFYPPERQLLWHNENSFNHRWPCKIMFCCVRPADSGGETPLVDSREVFARVDPRLRQRFVDKQVMYVRNYGAGLGLDWQAVFGTGDRAAVEERCRAEGMRCEWRPAGVLRTSCVRPAVVCHPATGEPSWFNQAQHWHVSCLDPETRESLAAIFADDQMQRNCYFGDGSPIEDSAMAEILAIYRHLEVSFPWQAGDVVLVDNVLTAHGRNAFAGPRKLLVALGAMSDFTAVSRMTLPALQEVARLDA